MSLVLLSEWKTQVRIVAFGKQGLYFPLSYAQTKLSSCVWARGGVLHSPDSPFGGSLSVV